MDWRERELLVMAAFGLVAALALVSLFVALSRAVLQRWPGRSSQLRSRWSALRIALQAAPGLVGIACYLYGALVEVDQLEVVREEVKSAHLAPGERVRIVLLSDLHVDHETPVLARLPEVVNGLDADLVVFDGDALNAAEGLPIFRRVLGAMNARTGRFAVRGNHDVWYWSDQDLFGGGVATELNGEPVPVLDGKVVLCGVAFRAEPRLAPCLERAKEEHPGALVLAIHHYPDLVEDVAPLAPDLYLAGHTHGGQVRAPIYGAIMTRSKFGKKYEMGRYQVDRTVLYVNRGIGLEPPPAPPVRFLAVPEVTVLDVVGVAR